MPGFDQQIINQKRARRIVLKFPAFACCGVVELDRNGFVAWHTLIRREDEPE
jgi:hypothetical protein